MTAAVWFVSVERAGARAEWDCETLGVPDVRDLLPTRRPSSGDFSRHIPRRAFSVTTGSALELESGLEHDLLRWLDLRPDVIWLVGQPVRFHFPAPERHQLLFHTPDLLSQHDDGSAVLWDVRPAARRDDKFALKAELIAEACRSAGWRHEVFDGLPGPMQMNFLWLNGYRRPMPWHDRWSSEIESLLRRRPRAVGEVRGRDGGDGELVATMWHLIAIGKVRCALDHAIRNSSTLAWAGGNQTQAAECELPPTPSTPRTCTDALVEARLRGTDR